MQKYKLNDKVQVLNENGKVSFQGVIISYIEKSKKYLVLIGSMKLTVEEERIRVV